MSEVGLSINFCDVKKPLSSDYDTQEIWAVVGQWPEYAVSTHGRVMRLTTKNSGKAGAILKPVFCGGYPSVNLCRGDGHRKSIRIHRIEAEAFLDKPDDATEVNHIDSVRRNNLIQNLEWVTSSGNRLHAYKSGGLKAKGSDNGYSKLTDDAVINIRTSGDSRDTLALRHAVSTATINDVLARRTWRHLP